MARGFNILSGFIGAAFKIGKVTSKDFSKRKPSLKNIVKAQEHRRKVNEESELLRLKLIENFSNQLDVSESTSLKEIQAINNEWAGQFEELRRYIQRGKYFESSGQLTAAIESYTKAIRFGESSSRLKYVNYAHPIKRVIILFGKLKEKEKLKEYLQTLISIYPNEKETTDWKHRLSKIK